MIAAAYGQIRAACRLLAGGADVHQRGVLRHWGFQGNALCRACEEGNEEVAHLLVEAGAANDAVEIIRALLCAHTGGLPKSSKIVQLLQHKRRRRLGPFARRASLARRGRNFV
ncbi:unnamed protein product [Symbiodinium pilosum]|uniref:Uncharacterized protein n=1 Tax=Symbiodinium pilosum TaxID=2952 RepID=A0A812WKZ1_SYMPI|nr:unnamed protein product [Symbiodinium pilosum]